MPTTHLDACRFDLWIATAAFRAEPTSHTAHALAEAVNKYRMAGGIWPEPGADAHHRL